MRLRISKCTQQGNSSLAWQAETSEKRKFYLILSVQKERGGYIHFLNEKPPGKWEASGSFSSLIRKHLNTCILTGILTDPENKNIWLTLQAQSQNWYIHIHHEGAVEISLISPDQISLIRLGAKGVFTKRKELESAPQVAGLKDELAHLLSTLTPKTSLDKTSDTEPILADIPPIQRDLRRRLVRKLKTVRQAEAKLEKESQAWTEIGDLEKKARLLQTFLYKLNPGDSFLDLSSEETGDAGVRIEVPTDRSPSEYLSDLFERVKKIKRGQQTLAEQVEKVKREVQALEADILHLENTRITEAERLGIHKRFHIPVEKSPQSREGESTARPYKVFKNADAIEFLVGKGPRENDELTKSARSNDYWFHAIGLGGSHVVVSYQSLSKSGLTESIKREACILALHFSKQRKDLAGEVYVTQRRFVSKKKGMPPGLWNVLQSETVFVSYTEEELKKVLSGS